MVEGVVSSVAKGGSSSSLTRVIDSLSQAAKQFHEHQDLLYEFEEDYYSCEEEDNFYDD